MIVDSEVFVSEQQLYNKSKLNHRNHLSYSPVKIRLFQDDEWDKSPLFPLLQSGAGSMKEKLCAYARSQLPGGKYYEPEDNNTKQILSTLKL